MKKILYVVIALVLLIGVYFIYSNTYKVFKPMLFDGDAFRNVKVDNDSLFYMNLKTVLDYHRVENKTNQNGEVLIKRKVSKDKELLHNYTRKAMDSVWIHDHSVY